MQESWHQRQRLNTQRQPKGCRCVSEWIGSTLNLLFVRRRELRHNAQSTAPKWLFIKHKQSY